MTQPALAHSQSLLQQAADGDDSAASRLLDETGPTVYGFIFARVGGDPSVAEDLLQATYLQGIRSAGTYRAEAALSTWLCTIARREVAKHFERERKRSLAESSLRLVDADQTTPDAADVAFGDSEEVIECLGRLPILHRQVLVLKYMDGLSVAEIAEELGKSPVQIQSLLQRARLGIKNELESRDG